MKEKRFIFMSKYVLVSLLVICLFLPAQVLASNSNLKVIKTIKTNSPCYITVTSKQKTISDGYHTVGLAKGKTTYYSFTTVPRNGYTVRWMVPKGTYKLSASCKASKLKITKTAFSTMKGNQNIKWKLKAKPQSGYQESDINVLCYKFKAPSDGYFSFKCNDSAVITLYDESFKTIAYDYASKNGDGVLALQGKKTYYLSFTKSSMAEKDSFTIKCKYIKKKNEAGTSKNKMTTLKNETVTGIMFAKASQTRWIKYKVTGNESLHHFYLDVWFSSGGSVKTDIYKNGKIIKTQTGGGYLLQSFLSEPIEKGDTLWFAVSVEASIPSDGYPCGYFQLKKG